MKKVMNVLAVLLVVCSLSISAHASEKAAAKAATDEKPMTQEVAMLTIDAIVESVDREARKVTLKNAEGESKTFTLDEDAGKLDGVDAGDLLTIEYLAAVTIQVFGADEIAPGSEGAAVVAETVPGEKPAALAAEQVSIVVTIESIDLENELVTLKTEKGETETVAPRNPENLKKVTVGDRVKITYTEAIAFSVTEKTPTK